MIEFLKDRHIYLKDGIIIPSVTHIINQIMPMNDSIPINVLKKAAEFGTQVHSAIELIESGLWCDLSLLEQHCINEYESIKASNKWVVLSQEKIVIYQDKYAGTYDMLCNINDKLCLLDIKTTYATDIKKLEWQLGMYKLAYESENDDVIEKCYCIWLPKRKGGKLIEITPKSKEEIEGLLNEIETE